MSAISFAPPRTGWMKGQYDNAKLDLNFDRSNGTVKGEVEGSTVSLHNDPDSSTITGAARNRPADITYNWTPEHQHYEGQAAGGNVNFDVDYTNHSVLGSSGDSAIKIRFDENSAVGEAGGPVQLQLSNDGHLQGTMCGHAVDAQTANVDMGQILSNIYLFAPGT
jgi:hypothetical protein